MNSKCSTPTGRVLRTQVLFVLCLCLFLLFPSIYSFYPPALFLMMEEGSHECWGVFTLVRFLKKFSWLVV